VSSANTALTQGDYPAFGTWIGKLTSDILVKNPLTPGWQRHNSEVMRNDVVEEHDGVEVMMVKGKMMSWLGMKGNEKYAEFQELQQAVKSAKKRL
jgi:hypothetical protein